MRCGYLLLVLSSALGSALTDYNPKSTAVLRSRDTETPVTLIAGVLGDYAATAVGIPSSSS
jgi:hypothetical protein